MEISHTKKILFFTQLNQISQAGSTLNALSIAKELRKFNVDVKHLSFGHSYRSYSFDNVECQDLRLRKNALLGIFIHLVNTTIIISQLMKGYQFVVYGVPHGRVSLLCAARIFRRTIIFRSTMFGDDDLASIRFKLPVTWFLLKRSRVIYWAITPEFYQAALGLDIFKVVHFSQGCRFPVTTSSTSNKFQHKQLKYLAVGHLIKRKGVLDLIRLIDELNIKMAFVGHNDLTIPSSLRHLKEEMFEMRSKLLDRAKVIGPAESVSLHFAENDIFLHFALKEGLPNVVIEAMAHGCVSLVRRLPGIEGYLIEHGINGFLFDTIDDAIEIIKGLETNSYNLDEISHQAKRTIQQNFSINLTSKKLLNELYDN